MLDVVFMILCLGLNDEVIKQWLCDLGFVSIMQPGVALEMCYFFLEKEKNCN